MVSSDSFRLLLEVLPHVAVQGFQPDGTIHYWNRASEQMHGYAAADVIDRDLVELIIPKGMREQVRTVIRQCVETGNPSTPSEMEFVSGGGAMRTMLACYLFVRETDRASSCFGVQMDVSSVSQACSADEDQRTFLRAMLDHLPDSVFAKDLESRFTLCNPKVARDLGVASKDEVIGKSDFDFMDRVTAQRHFDEEQRIMRSGEAVIEKEETYFDSRKKLPGWYVSSKIPLRDEHQNVIGLLGLNSEISERRRAEEALRQSELFLKETQKIARLGGWKANPQTDYLEWTEGIYELLDAPRDYKPGFKEGSAFLLPEYVPVLTERLLACLRDQSPFAMECELTTRAGKRLWVEMRGLAPIAEGTRTFVIGTMQDITDRKQMEERLRQSEKMDAIGQLAGGVAHDFNNQLAGIMGYADMLLDRLQDENLRGLAQSILTSTRRAADLTQELLAFARKGRFRVVPVDMHAILSEVAHLLERTIDKRISIRRDFHAQPHVVMGDPSQLQNAILNLGLNARDAMPKGGTLVLSTEVCQAGDDGGVAASDGLPPGLYLLISVSDTGVGMDQETLKHLFEPFFTTKEPGKGTGMGLAAVYGAAKGHRGMVSVESALGHGSTFRIWLPVVDAPSESEPAPVRPLRATPRARVLIVDDEEMVGAIAAMMLRTGGHRVTVCTDGRKALEVYAQSHKEIDLVLLDMVMPGMGGRELFQALREIDPGIKAVLSSGYSLDGEAQAILDEGVQGFIQKPYRAAELNQLVGEVLQ